MSRLNHSCIPNAAWEQENDHFRVFALCHISQGEEITVCYNENFFYMTTNLRKALQKHIYGFICDCKACDTSNDFSRISDERRTLIGHLYFRLAGMTKPDFDLPGAEEAETNSTMPLIGRIAAHPHGPLAVWSDEAVEHQIGLAELLREEGLLGLSVADHYNGAARSLCEQLVEYARCGRPPQRNTFHQILKWKRLALTIMATYKTHGSPMLQAYHYDLSIVEYCVETIRRK